MGERARSTLEVYVVAVVEEAIQSEFLGVRRVKRGGCKWVGRYRVSGDGVDGQKLRFRVTGSRLLSQILTCPRAEVMEESKLRVCCLLSELVKGLQVRLPGEPMGIMSGSELRLRDWTKFELDRWTPGSVKTRRAMSRDERPRQTKTQYWGPKSTCSLKPKLDY